MFRIDDKIAQYKTTTQQQEENNMRKIFKFIKRTLFVVGGLFALLFISLLIDISNDDEQAAQEVTAPVEEDKEAKPVVEPIKAAPVAPPVPTQAEKEQKSLEILQNSFAGNATITFDKEMKAFNILSTDPAFAQAMTFVASGNLSEEFETMKAQFVDGSKSLQSSLGSGYIINLQNPLNPDNTLLMVMDGIVVYSIN
jgi:hypothetical protein